LVRTSELNDARLRRSVLVTKHRSVKDCSQSLDTAPCAFCEIVAGRLPATIVGEDIDTVAFLDLRQFHPGHVLVVPRVHVADIRMAEDRLAAAVLAMVARIARAVDHVFPADGLSIWHSAGPGANQEVPHLHFHVHPRRNGDDLLRVYPRPPATPDRDTLEAWGAELTQRLTAISTGQPNEDVGKARFVVRARRRR
jgi:histidine triad (HIT) family protein